jgi:hypothetical protein
LNADAPCPPRVRYAYRSFDRQWLLHDPRLGDFLRPALWSIAGPEQVFLTSLLTHPLGSGPAAVATRLVPDLDHFRGSFGGRAVLPLWCDAAATEPNLMGGLLSRLAEAYGVAVEPRSFLAYCYALLSAPAYQARFADELREPGARMPLTARRELFLRTAGLGERLLRLHTFDTVPRGRARVHGPSLRSAQTGSRNPRSAIPEAEPHRRHERACHDAARLGSGHLQHETVCHAGARLRSGDPRHGTFCYDGARIRIGDLLVGPVDRSVWDFSVSGLQVVKSWLRYRQRAQVWSPEITAELLELLWLLEATVAMQPTLEAALDDVCTGPTLTI